MASKRVPATVTKSVSQSVKTAWHKASSGLSLKQFLKTTTTPNANEWFANKRANTSKPPLGIGATRKKKSKDGKKP